MRGSWGAKKVIHCQFIGYHCVADPANLLTKLRRGSSLIVQFAANQLFCVEDLQCQQFGQLQREWRFAQPEQNYVAMLWLEWAKPTLNKSQIVYAQTLVTQNSPLKCFSCSQVENAHLKIILSIEKLWQPQFANLILAKKTALFNVTINLFWFLLWY